ncbi:hypothetical protein N9901_02875 [Flavobacteriaceae bacterium]|nr:hypothetical protein [Flavobacteriaceae bacterium]
MFRKLILTITLFTAVSSFATNNTQDPVDFMDVSTPGIAKEKVNFNEVKEMFRTNKRVDNILTPKRKLRKVKYTIA